MSTQWVSNGDYIEYTEDHLIESLGNRLAIMIVLVTLCAQKRALKWMGLGKMRVNEEECSQACFFCVKIF